MKRLKVVSVVGTRPEIIRLSRVVAALEDLRRQPLGNPAVDAIGRPR